MTEKKDGGGQQKGSPLDVEGVDLGLTAEEIVSALREVRER